jgi:TonB family protein
MNLIGRFLILGSMVWLYSGEVALAQSSTSSASRRIDSTSDSPPLYAAGELDSSSAFYPPIARNYNIEGHVTGGVLVGEQGEVLDLRVEKSTSRLFDTPAMQVVQTIHFTPARKNGVAVRSWVSVPVRFALSDPTPAQQVAPR